MLITVSYKGGYHCHETARLPVMGPPRRVAPVGSWAARWDRSRLINLEVRRDGTIPGDSCDREILRAWLAGRDLRSVAEQAGVDRKTVASFVDAAVVAGLDRDRGEDQLADELINEVVAAVRPARPTGHGAAVRAHGDYHVHVVVRDYHVHVGKALCSAPKSYLGQQVQARADARPVELFHRAPLIKTHPWQPAGGRCTDPEDLPAEKTTYALPDLQRLVRAAARHGHNVGIYAERLLDDKLPWTRMRQLYRLRGLARRYGSEPVDTACGWTLAIGVVSVTEIASMLEETTERTRTPAPRAAQARTRFAHDASEFRRVKPYWLKVIDGGAIDGGAGAGA